MNYIAVGIGGMAGSVLRYLIGLYTIEIWHGGFPYGTFIVNVTGALILGFLTGWQYEKKLPSYIVSGLGTGFIGSFTTFSALSLETVQLIDTSPLTALLYVVLSSVIGLFMAFFGLLLGKNGSRKDTV
ncbi:fluoride efflux transporter CrcB [Siminovitchia sp. FSL W7-1587]|uniref:fluoride efflux transporter CrcB n=1 Tax=Siminovitchia sp. FSL W7-1587 TaxID=2954699 RepID=UPI0030CC7155